jgi:hypothetical protein
MEMDWQTSWASTIRTGLATRLPKQCHLLPNHPPVTLTDHAIPSAHLDPNDLFTFLSADSFVNSVMDRFSHESTVSVSFDSSATVYSSEQSSHHFIYSGSVRLSYKKTNYPDFFTDPTSENDLSVHSQSFQKAQQLPNTFPSTAKSCPNVIPDLRRASLGRNNLNQGNRSIHPV